MHNFRELDLVLTPVERTAQMNKGKKLTKSPENQRVVDLIDEIGIETMGIMSSQSWYDDPRGLLFTLAR